MQLTPDETLLRDRILETRRMSAEYAAKHPPFPDGEPLIQTAVPAEDYWDGEQWRLRPTASAQMAIDAAEAIRK